MRDIANEYIFSADDLIDVFAPYLDLLVFEGKCGDQRLCVFKQSEKTGTNIVYFFIDEDVAKDGSGYKLRVCGRRNKGFGCFTSSKQIADELGRVLRGTGLTSNTNPKEEEDNPKYCIFSKEELNVIFAPYMDALQTTYTLDGFNLSKWDDKKNDGYIVFFRIKQHVSEDGTVKFSVWGKGGSVRYAFTSIQQIEELLKRVLISEMDKLEQSMAKAKSKDNQ